MAAVDVSVSGARSKPAAGASNPVVTVAVPRANTDELAESRITQDGTTPATDSAGSDPVSLTLGIGAALPTPTVNGNVATYDNVEPGRDLRVKVTPSGVETFLDIETRPSQIPSTGVAVSFPVSSKGLSVATDADGGLRITETATGRVVGDTPPARIWDASVDPASADSRHALTVRTSLRQAANGWVVTSTIPADYFDTPGLTYPITVDPSATLPPSRDTYAEKGYNDTTFGSEDDLKVGTYDSGTHVGRSYIQFTLSDATGFYDTTNQLTVVDSAKLKLWEWHAASCTPSDMQIRYLTEPFTEGSTTWNTRPGQSGAVTTVSDAHRDDSSGACAAGWFDTTSGTDVKAIAQAWANGSYPNYGFALTGSETSSTSWKRFYSAEYATASKRPSLVLTYHKKAAPATPSGLRLQYTDAQLASQDGTAPTLQAKVSATESSTVYARFAVYQGATKVWPTSASYVTGSPVASGGQSLYAMPTGVLHAGTSYTFKAWGWDGQQQSAASATSAAFDARITVSSGTYESTPASSLVADPSLTETQLINDHWVPAGTTADPVPPMLDDAALQAEINTSTDSYGTINDTAAGDDNPDDDFSTPDTSDDFVWPDGTLDPSSAGDVANPAPADTFAAATVSQDPLVIKAVKVQDPAAIATWDASGSSDIAAAIGSGTLDITSSANYSSDLSACRSAESGPSGWYRNRFFYCHWMNFHTWHRSSFGIWESNTTATFRVTEIVRTTQDTRDVIYQTAVDLLKGGGDNPQAAQRFNLTLSPVCDSANCSSLYGAPTPTRQLLSWNNSSAFWRWTQPSTYGYGPDAKSTGSYRMNLTLDHSNMFPLEPYTFHYSSPSVRARCDTGVAFARTKHKSGCVFPKAIPVDTYRLSSLIYPAVSHHIWLALNYPSLTMPKWNGKYISSTLTRYYPRPAGSDSKNRYRVRKACLARDPNYASKGLECDEFPFNSTRQRALDSVSGLNFSGLPVPAAQNRAAGKALNKFYVDNRVLGDDQFRVRVI
jgi:hypothetical protein